MPRGPGLDDHVKGRAERLASHGYTAFVLDYHGGGVQLPLEQTMARLGVLMDDPALTRRLGLAGLDVLLSQETTDGDRVAVIGYCFGGAMALEVARTGADVKAVVGFHPGLPTSTDSEHIKGSVLMCVGAADSLIGIDQHQCFEQDMIDAGVTDWTLEVYGGVGHSFTNPAVDELGMAGVAYDAKADAPLVGPR